MGHIADYRAKLKFGRNNEIIFEVTALWKSKKEVVQKLFEDGSAKERYIYNSNFCGITTTYPGERNGYYYGYHEQEKIAWSSLKKNNRPYTIGIWRESRENDLKMIAEKRPEFKYLIKKIGYYQMNIYGFIKLINIYKEHPQIESLVEKKLFSIAMDKRLFKLTKNKMCEVINFIKNNNLESYQENLSYILWKIKNPKLDPKIYEYIKREKLDLESAKYLINTKQEQHINSYKDYLDIADKCGHDIKNEYWKFPKDIMKAHNKVHEEYKEILRAREQARIEQEKIDLQNKQSDFAKIAKKYIKYNFEIDGYKVYVPQSIKDIIDQAENLHQCLVRCDYIGKMEKGNCILVFVKKGDKPISTFELNKKYEVVQHYQDERDYAHCSASEELKSVANNFIKLVQKKQVVATA